MIAEPLQTTLEATGYLLDDGQHAPGLSLAPDPTPRRMPSLSPDAWWRSGWSAGQNGGSGASNLMVFFKFAERPDEQVAEWQRDVWNLGFAPLLWVVSPHRTDVYNGFGIPQVRGEEHRNLLRTFDRSREQLEELDTFAGRLAMETGQFWERPGTVNRRTGVDARLLGHLSALEDGLLRDGLDRGEAQGLIGRTIFAKYLLDRDIVGAGKLRDLCGYDDLPEVLADREATQRLFGWLTETFNGDMFPEHLQPPETEHLDRVVDFLRGDDPTGQMSLFPYRFDVIPVELISSIYERFVHQSAGTGSGSDHGQPKKRGVYYTPVTAVSMVLDKVFDGLTGDETVIDLTCGSGVFLVEALRRLVRLKANGGRPTRGMIRRALYEQVYGVDISESAVRIAAFSLYLAALELDPNPRDRRSLRFDPLVGKTLLAGDAHGIEETEEGREVLTTNAGLKKFDVVVGNPPWTYQGRAGTTARRAQGTVSGRSPRGESLDFIHRGLDFAHAATRFGVLVSASPFFARSGTGVQAAQGVVESLGSVTLVNLSDLSGWLFAEANMPAMALLARHQKRQPETMELVHVPRSPEGARSRTIGVVVDDFVPLPTDSWRRNPDLLKTGFIGGPHDLLLMDGLWERYDSLKKRLGALGTKMASGAKRGNQGRNRGVGHLHGLPFLTTGELGRFTVPKVLPDFPWSWAERPRKRHVYRSPIVLVKESIGGSGTCLRDGRPVVAVAERDMVYPNAYFGVSLHGGSPDVAHLLAGVLSSALASWYFLMAGSSFGIWKRIVRLGDVTALPAPDLEAVTSTDAGRRVIGLVRRFHATPPGDGGWQALDEAVFDLYELDPEERIVVADGRLRATWQWKAGWSAADRGAQLQHLEEYASAFLLSMDAWLYAANERRFRAEIHDTGSASPLRVVRFVLEDHPPPSQVVESGEVPLRHLLRDIQTRLEVSVAKELVGARELRIYGRREVVIVKPAARRYWLGVAGLDDARAVLAKSFGVAEG